MKRALPRFALLLGLCFAVGEPAVTPAHATDNVKEEFKAKKRVEPVPQTSETPTPRPPPRQERDVVDHVGEKAMARCLFSLCCMFGFVFPLAALQTIASVLTSRVPDDKA